MWHINNFVITYRCALAAPQDNNSQSWGCRDSYSSYTKRNSGDDYWLLYMSNRYIIAVGNIVVWTRETCARHVLSDARHFLWITHVRPNNLKQHWANSSNCFHHLAILIQHSNGCKLIKLIVFDDLMQCSSSKIFLTSKLFLNSKLFLTSKDPLTSKLIFTWKNVLMSSTSGIVYSLFEFSNETTSSIESDSRLSANLPASTQIDPVSILNRSTSTRNPTTSTPNRFRAQIHPKWVLIRPQIDPKGPRIDL